MRNYIYLLSVLCGMASCTTRPYFSKDKFTCNVATYKGDAESAVSFTFDDGCENQFIKAMPVFDRHNLNMTLFLTTNWVNDWQRIADAAISGHEIGCHTLSHPNLSELSSEKAEEELSKAKSEIERNIPGYECKTIAYPFCVPPLDSIMCSKYFFAARHCQGFVEGYKPVSYLNISSQLCGDVSSLNTGSNIIKSFESARLNSGWSVLLFHGLDDDGSYSPMSTEELRYAVEFLDSNRHIYWTDTFGAVAMYMKQRDAAHVSNLEVRHRRVTFCLEDDLDDAYFNQLLTMKCSLPEGFRGEVVVCHNGIEVASRVREEEDGVKVMFDVMPDGGTITIEI